MNMDDTMLEMLAHEILVTGGAAGLSDHIYVNIPKGYEKQNYWR